MYYNGSDLLSYNRLFNFVIGSRGTGKTYWATSFGVKDFIKNGNMFLYVRRYDTELKKRNLFFNAIAQDFPDYTFDVKGYEAIVNKKTCGYFMALSKAKIEKSIPFPKVKTIIFDEFILDKGNYHYIYDEVINFLDLYETIARSRNNVRVIFLSNAITVTNPYFLYFNINLNDTSKRFYTFGDELLVEMVKNPDFIALKEKTRFGKLIKGTRYGDFAINNKMLRDNDVFIKRKTSKSRNIFSMRYKGKLYHVWIDVSTSTYYVSNDFDPNNDFIYAITQEDHTPNSLLLKSRQSSMLNSFIQNYKKGNVYFENINLKNVVFEIVRLSLI